jgi:hypothetical protein
VEAAARNVSRTRGAIALRQALQTDAAPEPANAAVALLRQAVATAVRALATGLLGGRGRTRRLAVVGDLNDEPRAATTQILPGSEIGTGGFDRSDGGDGRRLWNLAPTIPPARRFSRVFRGRRELIDHIVVSRALLPVLGGVDRPQPSVGEDPAARRRARDSDHAPVLARLDL